MSRAWKPGDVAIVSGSDGAGVRAIRQTGQWATENSRYLNDWQVNARPLVVIDPEDEGGDLSRLWRTLPPSLVSIDQLQAALREFADPKPPKPAEPTGLGAVVEDAEGELWVRVGDKHFRSSGNIGSNKYRTYGSLAAVRVLSEGVTA